MAPYHPSSNGLAKCFVKSFRVAMNKSEKDGLSFYHHLATFLLSYCTTPHAMTNVAPCVFCFWMVYLLHSWICCHPTLLLLSQNIKQTEDAA